MGAVPGAGGWSWAGAPAGQGQVVGHTRGVLRDLEGWRDGGRMRLEESVYHNEEDKSYAKNYEAMWSM